MVPGWRLSRSLVGRSVLRTYMGTNPMLDRSSQHSSRFAIPETDSIVDALGRLRFGSEVQKIHRQIPQSLTPVLTSPI